MRRPLAGLVGLLVAGAGAPAAASPLFELWGAQGEGGHSARVLPAGAASTYFNPALLPEATADFDLGVAVVADQIGVRLRGRPSAAADVSVQSVDAERPGGGRYERYGLPTEWLQNGKPATPPDPSLAARPRQGKGSGHQVRAYQLVGMVRKLLDDRLAVGLIAMIPYSEFTGAAAFYSDEREQYFSNSLHPELYADRLTATSLAFGLGARLGDRLSVGASCTLALRTVAGTPTYLGDVGRFQDIMVDSDVGVKTSVAPHFGAALALSPATRLAATVHTPQKTEIGTDFSFLLPSGLEQRARIRFTHAYLPWTVGPGRQPHAGRPRRRGRHAGGHGAVRALVGLRRPARRAAGGALRLVGHGLGRGGAALPAGRRRPGAGCAVSAVAGPRPDGADQLRRQRSDRSGAVRNSGRERRPGAAAAVAFRTVASVVAPGDGQAAARSGGRWHGCWTRCRTTLSWGAIPCPVGRACRPTTPDGQGFPALATCWGVV